MVRSSSSEDLDNCASGRTLGERGSAGGDGCGRSSWLGPRRGSAGSDCGRSLDDLLCLALFSTELWVD